MTAGRSRIPGRQRRHYLRELDALEQTIDAELAELVDVDPTPWVGWVEEVLVPGDEWEAELEPTRAAIEVCLAEAGYPGADVYIDGGGIHVEGAPDDLADRAQDLTNQVAPRSRSAATT